MGSAKAEYREFCKVETSIPVFSRAWWLDAAAGDGNWDVVMVKQGNEIVATMPYFRRKRLGFTLITQPPLTQTLGPWLTPVCADANGQIKHQHKLLQALIDQLPPFDYFHQRWHYANTNWLPFYWSGFEQTTRYTYVIDDLTDLDAVFAGFSHNKRRHIRRAEGGNIRVRFDIPARTFYENHKMTLAQSGAKIMYSYELFERIYESGYENGSVCAIGAYDKNENLHAAVFVIWDENSAYALLNTLDHNFRSSGATALLTREMIRRASVETRKFDFEGSMIKSVESSVREFNTRQVPYLSVFKVSSRLYSAARFIKSLGAAR
jgi:lipid II:glycine glycyltransferase (peptidoglycan interpeptide bridge formation enzyme)